MSPVAAARLSPATLTEGAGAADEEGRLAWAEETSGPTSWLLLLNVPGESAGRSSAETGTSGSARASVAASFCKAASAAARPWVRSVHRRAMNWARPSSIHGWVEWIQIGRAHV